MLRSFASEVSKHLFLGNWSMSSGKNYGQLEECFFDLRLLDAAATTRDLERLFGLRLTPHGRGSGDRYGMIVSDSNAPFTYRISFVWTGEDAEQVSVDLSDAGRKGD